MAGSTCGTGKQATLLSMPCNSIYLHIRKCVNYMHYRKTETGASYTTVLFASKKTYT